MIHLNIILCLFFSQEKNKATICYKKRTESFSTFVFLSFSRCFPLCFFYTIIFSYAVFVFVPSLFPVDNDIAILRDTPLFLHREISAMLLALNVTNHI